VLPVASGLSSTSYTLETELFDHASGSITVIASDGYHRSSDRVSDITVGVSVDPLNTSPNRYQLGQNYPNPFNDGTTIQYVVPKVGKAVPVRIDIYNTLGEIIHTLVNKSQNPGTYSITWNGDYKNGKIAPTGVYFYRLQVGGNEQVKKMLKMQ
jgi:flagellar hook assembly protein FlgD